MHKMRTEMDRRKRTENDRGNKRCISLKAFSIYRPFIFLSERIPRVPSTAFYKFPKAVIDNGRRRNAHRQLDECAPLAFNYRSILSVYEAIGRPSVRPSLGPHVRYFGRNNIESNPMAGTGRADPAVPEYLWGPKSN